MANKKVSQLVAKPSVLVTDLFPIADPTTGQLFKTTISDLGTAIGSGVSSVNTLVGAVVLDTDDIQELASPTNRWFTDTRARAALSASSPLAYNSGTGVFSIPAATSSQDGYLSSADWTTFNAKQAALSGTGFVKISGTTISYDNSTYLTTSAAASTYLALAGGTLTGALNGTSATFTGDLTLSATNPRLYFTDTDNNPDYFISNTDGTFTIYDVTNSQSRFTIGTTGNGTFGGNLTVGQIIRSGGTSAQFLKADGSVDSSTYAKRSGLTDGYLPAWSSSLLGGSLTDSFISYASNITYVSGMGLSTLNGLDIEGNYGAGTGGLKIRSYDETTGNAYIDFANTGGRMYLGLNRSTAGGLMTNATAYATVLTTGLGTANLEFGTNATKRLTIDGTTGAITATSSVTSSGYYLTGMTAGSGALYYSSGSNRVTVANYNASGIVTFEVNGGSTALTLNSNLSATFAAGGSFAGALSGTTLALTGGTGGINFTNSTTITNTASSGFTAIYANGGGIYLGGSASTNHLSILSSGNVGINTTSPTQRLEVVSNNVRVAATDTANGTAGFYMRVLSGGTQVSNATIRTDNTGLFSIFTGTTGETQSLNITSAGNVGIGTTSPDRPLDIYNASLIGIARIRANNTDGAALTIQNDENAQSLSIYSVGSAGFGVSGWANNALIESLTGVVYSAFNGNHIFQSGTSGRTERMRITSGGEVCIARTSSLLSSVFSIDQFGSGSTNIALNHFYSGNKYIDFGWYSSSIGSITNTSGVSVSYNTTSDYRLKEDLKSINGLEIVSKINVYDYKWKSVNLRMGGVLAHELAEVLPYAVTGVKDGEQMQSVDYSKIVPVMVQAIKDLKKELDTLKNK